VGQSQYIDIPSNFVHSRISNNVANLWMNYKLWCLTSLPILQLLHFTHSLQYSIQSVDGDADSAVEVRIPVGWNKFRQLVPLLTNKDISLIGRGRLYSSFVQSSMLHGSETWPVRKENEMAL